MTAQDLHARLATFARNHRDLALRGSRKLGLSLEAEDLVQEALARTAASGHIPDDEDGMRAWFFRVLRNLAANRRRASRVRERASDTLAIVLETHAPPSGRDPLLRARILDALSLLSPAQRTVVTLVYLEERTVDEAAARMACAAGTARSHLHRALASLRVSLDPLRDRPHPAGASEPSSADVSDSSTTSDRSSARGSVRRTGGSSMSTRTNRTRSTGSIAAGVAWAIAGCGGGGPSTDASTLTDATPTVDAAPIADDGSVTEAGPVSDAAPVTDAGAVTDASGPAARCAVVTESIRAAGFSDKVTVRCDDRYAYVVSDTYPDHVKMDGIRATNDQVPVPAPGYTSPIALSPARAARPTSIDAALGVAVNGVPIYDYSSQGTLDLSAYDPRFDTLLTGELDQCNGHSGRGDDYHYHASPTCMIAAMRNRGPSAILGWGFDGYPIYGDANPDGTPIAAGTLDVCNAQPDPVFGQRYHTSAMHPYILQCLVGQVDLTMAPRVAPLMRLGGGGGRPPGEKPPGGVTMLRLAENPDGSRRMTYVHMGTTYSIAYRPSSTMNCWDYEDASYTTRGVLQRGTYCRSPR